MVIAVDFDGTLSNGSYPHLGEPNLELFQKLIEGQKNGDRIILWTCRESKELQEAIEYCKSYGLRFEAINDNLPGSKCNPRKIFADLYIDDRAMPREKFRIRSIPKAPKIPSQPKVAKIF